MNNINNLVSFPIRIKFTAEYLLNNKLIRKETETIELYKTVTFGDIQELLDEWVGSFSVYPDNNFYEIV